MNQRRYMQWMGRSAGVFLLLALCFSPPALGLQSRISSKDGKQGRSVRDAFAEVVAPAALRTVEVLIDGRRAAMGLCLDERGRVVTKASQLSDDHQLPLVVECRFDGPKRFEAKVLGVNLDHDLALLMLDPSQPDLAQQIASWAKLNPSKTEDEEADGAQKAVALEDPSELGLREGQWLVTASPGATPLSVGTLSRLPQQVGRREGFLGITMTDASGGVGIADVIEGTGADNAGVQVGDVVVAIDKEAMLSRRSLVEKVSEMRPGTRLELEIRRDGKRLILEAILGMRPWEDGIYADEEDRNSGRLSRVRSGFPRVIQHDGILDPRDCGGPLVNLEGRIVALNIARAGRTRSYAIPIGLVHQVAQEIERRAVR